MKLPDTGAVQLTVMESDVAFTFCNAATDSGSETVFSFVLIYIKLGLISELSLKFN